MSVTEVFERWSNYTPPDSITSGQVFAAAGRVPEMGVSRPASERNFRRQINISPTNYGQADVKNFFE
jgi:hypothetical protein